MSYSCRTNLDRPKFYTAQTGWSESGQRLTVQIPAFESNKFCRYDKRDNDPQCAGCERITDNEYLIKHGLKK